MSIVFQLNPADDEFNLLLPIIFGVIVALFGSILLLTCWLLYRHLGQSNSGRAVTIFSQAFISLIGTAVIGIISLAFAVSLQMVISLFR
jgi:hypothetical protein